ncbi:MAG: DedA family protein [candidate division Zixibacteria bacterium]
MIEFLSAGFNEMLAMVDSVDPLYIYLILFGIAFFENIFPPIPGDTFTIVGGYLAAIGKLSLIPTALFITLGTISSVMLIYILGYRGGKEFFERKNYRFFNARDVNRVDSWFDKYGALTLLVSRFIVGARVAVAIGAGISRYPSPRMFIYSYISGVLFHGVLIALAYLFHAYVDNIVEWFNLYSKIVLVVVGGLVIIWVVFVIRRIIHGRQKT